MQNKNIIAIPRRWRVAAPLLALLLAGCTALPRGPSAAQALPALPAALQPVDVEATPLAAPAQPCGDSFIAHDLDHITTVPGDRVEMFEANGAGVAIGDLDRDGALDLVLANHHDANTILWNEGGLRFRAERMEHGDSRAVNLVDLDADGWLDIVFTRRASAPNYWRNSGSRAQPRFVREVLPRIYKPANAMNWADLDGDTDLDLVAGSYDAGMLADQGNSYLLGNGAGVYYYENQSTAFAATRLAAQSQALAIALPDLDADGQRDIVVGNDFAVYDQSWLRHGAAWSATQPFSTTSHSTMSFDLGDVDNDGSQELFSTDMKPYAHDVATLATWRPLMAEMWEPPLKGDPQIMENVLQVRGSDGAFRNEAYQRGVDASGWSWSGKFGDLDNDGWLDLYVVNGMIEAEIFDYLPNHELVEQNQVFHNDGGGRFVPMPQWGLGSIRSGRGMSMADLDGDGDLEVVVNNLRSAAQLFENRLCGGSGFQVDLYWPQSKNTRAIGATLALHTSAGTFPRDVRAASGYLSGDPARIHFGVPANATLLRLDIRWPDGATSALDRPVPRALLTITRN
ncbi:MAG TPA: CRTAC1 family protein [Herpetosiphonaceae bacterium]